VRSGDTLATIAKAAYGDSQLWYLIADANGLSGDRDLRVGQTINIPTKVGGIHNNAGTFKPYDPSKVIGNTAPNLPVPQSDDDDCGGFGQIVMIVVAVVVAYFVGPEVLEAFGTATTTAGGLTLSGTAATSLVEAGAATWTTGSLVAAGAAGAAAGSVASQLVGNALGIVDGFSWKAVALAAISGGVGAGVGSLAGGTGPLSGYGFGATALRGAIGSALTQGIAVATGLQDHFDWKGVAARAIGAGVGSVVSQELGITDSTGVKTVAYRNAGFGEQLFKSTLTGLTAGATTAVLRGGRVDITRVASDAFGNALGEDFKEQIKQGSQQELARQQALQDLRSEVSDQNAADGSGPTAAQSEALARGFGPLTDEAARRRLAAQAQRSTASTTVGTDDELGQSAPSAGATTPRDSRYSVTVGSGDTVEQIARREYGENWRAGVAIIASQNELRTNRYGSPLIREGDAVNLRSLEGLSDDQLAALNRAGGGLVSRNSSQMSALQAAEERQRINDLIASAGPRGGTGIAYGDAPRVADGAQVAAIGRGEGGWLSEARASGDAFYTNAIANASNPVTAVAATMGRALNNAGYDVAGIVPGLYALATDSNVQARALSAVGNALAHPIDAAATAYNAGERYLVNTSIGQMGEDALRFGSGGFATAGAGKIASAISGVGLDAAAATGQWLAPNAALMAENYLARSGALLYAMPPQLKAGMVFEDAGVARAGAEAFQQNLAVRRLSLSAIGDDGNILAGRTVLDLAGIRADTGVLGGLEFKLSDNVSLTLRQEEHFGPLMRNGGVVRGENGLGIGLQPGMRVSPLDINRINGPTLPAAGDWWKK
jgi:hypothetical protein